jgi:digeranylgeranylglycerophospholipid reductase
MLFKGVFVSQMQDFDVVIIGAGPAGAHCARVLAKLGYQVLLVEQHESFSENDFSSAGTPIDTLDRFNLPQDVIGSLWHKIVVVTTKVEKTWESTKTLGAVLSFARLREFLAQDVKANGGDVWLGCRYISYEKQEGKTIVSLKTRSRSSVIEVSTKVLVDGTGFARAVMYNKESEKPPFLSGTGIEYLIEVAPEVYQKYADSLVFFLGHKWMPKGYSWIFPMDANRLKVGAGKINVQHQVVEETQPLRRYIEMIITDYLQIKEGDYQIVDIHGSTLKYSSGLNDIYYRDNTIAIGDAVSTVNFLGGEGIRHGMYGAEIAVKYIEKYLENEIGDFSEYQKEMLREFGTKWNLSERFALKKYTQDTDDLIEKAVAYLSALNAEDIMDLMFYYKFEKISKGLGKYIKGKLSIWWEGMRRKVRVFFEGVSR